jgi:nucleoside phosphorylase
MLKTVSSYIFVGAKSLTTSSHITIPINLTMSDPSIYTVGWICALSTEVTAARQFLDERHERADHVAPNSDGTYTLGKMAGHNVVIAMLPDREYGLSSAAAVVTDMLNSFPAIRIGLLVGIGGGAPTSKNDIRLGDVVVSSAQPNIGSVYQYDFGKTVQERSFQQTGVLGLPATVVRTAVTATRSEYEEGHDIEEQILAALQRKPMLRDKYSRPPRDSDILFNSNVVHPDGEDDCNKLCGTQPSNTIQRRQRGDDELNPAVHYGVIASANQLMKDATIRDTLAKEKGIMCFEMEAAGIMNRFPVLIVRGICDYADSHKNKRWQGYAAMAASAYSKDLLSRMVPDKVAKATPLAEAIDSSE